MNFLPLNAVLPKKLHPTLREVVECLYVTLVDALRDDPPAACPPQGRRRPPRGAANEMTVGAVEARAAEIARAQIAAIAHSVGGAAIYLPKDLRGLLIEARDREIWQKFTGNNLHALAREYGLTDMRVSQIIAACRAEERERRQGRLPGMDDA